MWLFRRYNFPTRQPRTKRGGDDSPPLFAYPFGLIASPDLAFQESLITNHKSRGTPRRVSGQPFTTPSALPSARRFLLLLFALLAQDGFAREANLVSFDGQHLDEDLVAQLQRVAHVAQALLGDFADVQESVGAGENFHEGAEFREAHDLAEVGLADFGGGCNVTDHLESGFGGRSTIGEHVHLAVVHDVDFHAGGFDNRPDFLSARANQVANFVRGNLQLMQPRSEDRHFWPGRRNRLVHDVQNV